MGRGSTSKWSSKYRNPRKGGDGPRTKTYTLATSPVQISLLLPSSHMDVVYR
jgi:hypothetical protein